MLSWFAENFDNVFAIATAVVTLASLIANLTPTETDNKVVNAIGKVVNFFALYWRNPDAPKP